MKKSWIKCPAFIIWLFTCLSVFSSEGFSRGKWNVLFIAIDDLKPVLNCYGASQIISPRMDEIAGKGVVFRNAYCQWPVCGATRASMLTGLTPDFSGIRNLTSQLREEVPDVMTLPQYFKENGYVTAAVGKVFDPRNVDAGHDTRSWTHTYTDPGSYTYPPEYGDFVKGQYRVTANTATERGPEGVDDDGYVDGQICLEALSKLDQFARSGENFFLAVGFKKPHIPFISPGKYWELYTREELSLAPFQKIAAGSPSYAYHTPEPIKYDDIPDEWTYSDPELGTNILHPDDQRKLLHGYYACVSYIDAQVGKLLDKLELTGLADSTIIILWGDHGYHLGDHNQWGKHTSFEQAVRAPLIIYSPGNRPSVFEAPVEFLDIYPTLCDLTGLKVSNVLQGESLAGVMNGTGKPSDVPAVSEYRSGGHAGYSFRTPRYRYTIWMDGSSTRPDQTGWSPDSIYEDELYDYQTDPLETVNLAGRNDYAAVRDSMITIASQWWGKMYGYALDPPKGNILHRIISNGDFFYPNPAGNYIWTGKDGIPGTFRIYSMNGALIMDHVHPGLPVDISCLPSDHYVVEWCSLRNIFRSLLVKIE